MKVNYPETIINKSSGSTITERYLSKLCKRSFLSMWSYSNIYRDQGKKGLGDGKEVCDLIVVFQDHILVFSDKDCTFPAGPNLKLNWTRWYNKAIFKSARQIFAAERWLLNFPDRIFLDKACTVRFPIDLPKNEVKFHRIVVAHGISKECKKALGGIGSLIINFSMDDASNLNPDKCVPFAIGNVIKEKGFVHVLDDSSLEVIMSSLDTITDFIKYLTAKENLLSGNTQIIASGEEELLAEYMYNITPKGEHAFPELNPEYTMCVFNQDRWGKFQASPERANQLTANKISYFWDSLIEKFVGHIFDGTSQFLSTSNINEQEKVFRILAKENRTRRRMLASAFLGLVNQTNENKRGTRTVIPCNEDEPCYVFLALPRKGSPSDEKYREFRRELLSQYCFITKLKVPNAKVMVGIATEPGESNLRSEDIILVEVDQWTPEDQARAESLEEELQAKGLRSKPTMKQSEVYEFPPTNFRLKLDIIKGKDRNKPCICNSGKKFKKCCGRFT